MKALLSFPGGEVVADLHLGSGGSAILQILDRTLLAQLDSPWLSFTGAIPQFLPSSFGDTQARASLSGPSLAQATDLTVVLPNTPIFTLVRAVNPVYSSCQAAPLIGISQPFVLIASNLDRNKLLPAHAELDAAFTTVLGKIGEALNGYEWGYACSDGVDDRALLHRVIAEHDTTAKTSQEQVTIHPESVWAGAGRVFTSSAWAVSPRSNRVYVLISARLSSDINAFFKTVVVEVKSVAAALRASPLIYNPWLAEVDAKRRGQKKKPETTSSQYSQQTKDALAKAVAQVLLTPKKGK